MLAAALLALAGTSAASPLDLSKRGPDRSLGWKIQVRSPFSPLPHR